MKITEADNSKQILHLVADVTWRQSVAMRKRRLWQTTDTRGNIKRRDLNFEGHYFLARGRESKAKVLRANGRGPLFF